MKGKGEMKKHLSRMVLIILIIGVWSFLFNAFSRNGIALIGTHEDYRVKPTAGDIFLQSVRDKFEYGLAIFVDSRSREQFMDGHIPGAISIPAHEMDELMSGFLIHCTPDLEYITYCDGTECDSSVIVANRLKSMGFDNVHIFFGGWKEWVKSGFPVEEGMTIDFGNNFDDIVDEYMDNEMETDSDITRE